MQAAWSKPVLDRVGLIIEIFGAHAQTKEAKLQVFSYHFSYPLCVIFKACLYSLSYKCVIEMK